MSAAAGRAPCSALARGLAGARFRLAAGLAAGLTAGLAAGLTAGLTLAGLLWGTGAAAQPLPAPPPTVPAGPANALNAAELDTLSTFLRAAMAGPRDAAFHQILSEATLVLAPSDSVAVYDVVVRYDPDRYHAPHAGLYPIVFEDQFIQWGKRVAVYSRSVNIQTGRFYLHDLSTGRHAWIYTEEARLLYRGDGSNWPPPAGVDTSAGQRPWLQLLHAIPAATPLMQMTRWLRLMRLESRKGVLSRVAQG